MTIHDGVDRSRGDAHALAFPTGLEKNVVFESCRRTDAYISLRFVLVFLQLLCIFLICCTT